MEPLPTLVQALVGIEIADIAAGLAHTLVASEEGDVYRFLMFC
jgi:alpha-tubulin suppressor-like RCC1 family protein